MIAGTLFLLCAFASVAIIAVVATLMAACDGDRGGWVLITLGIVMLVTDTFAALHAFEVIA